LDSIFIGNEQLLLTRKIFFNLHRHYVIMDKENNCFLIWAIF